MITFHPKLDILPGPQRALWPLLRESRAMGLVLYGGTEPDALTMLTNEGVKVSFFGNIDFGRVGLPEITADGIAEVASLANSRSTSSREIGLAKFNSLFMGG